MNIFQLLVLVSILAFSITLSMAANSVKSTRKNFYSTNSIRQQQQQQQRNRRQSLKRQPGFFFLLNQFVLDEHVSRVPVLSKHVPNRKKVYLETVNDTAMAYRNISKIFSDQFTTTSPSPTEVDGNSTTTPAPPLTMQQLFDVLGRNYRGLVRLFNREWNTALRDSNRNIVQFRRDFKESLRPFFDPNPNITNRIT